MQMMSESKREVLPLLNLLINYLQLPYIQKTL